MLFPPIKRAILDIVTIVGQQLEQQQLEPYLSDSFLLGSSESPGK